MGLCSSIPEDQRDLHADDDPLLVDSLVSVPCHRLAYDGIHGER